MAKRTPKETNVPLVFALVFFILTTIAFGVMWYMQFSDQQAKDETVKNAKKDAAAANALAKEADLNSKLYRIYLGINEGDDVSSMLAEHKKGDKLSSELNRINAALCKKFGVDEVAKLPADITPWSVDPEGKIPEPPVKTILEGIGDSVTKRKAADDREAAIRKDYEGAIAQIKAAIGEVEAAKKTFNDVALALPKDFAAKLQAEVNKFEGRKKLFTETEAKSREELTRIDEERARIEREKGKLKDHVDQLQKEILIQASLLTQKRDKFEYDEPQGKILRRLPEDVLEINLGSTDLVRPGLTFTVLPNDFPEKGRQSRVRVMRLPNERGEYHNVERFVEKATIEVTEVLGPHLSRARITSEFDKIRDGAAPGDLLYNSVWRKGSADHIALIGIFDINGDGTDDIESVVRDFVRMGVPVDAYFDMKKRQWVTTNPEGTLSQQTRYMVVGNYPTNSANDPNQADKTRLLQAMSDAIGQGRQKGIQDVSYRDFFPRMGYRAKIDIPADKINQATAPYLNRVALDAGMPEKN